MDEGQNEEIQEQLGEQAPEGSGEESDAVEVDDEIIQAMD